MSATFAEIIISASASLAGAAAAAYASYLIGRGTRLHEWKLALIRERLLERRQLYAKFVAEADRNMLSISSGGAKSMDNVMSLFAMFAEISLLSPDAVQDAAKMLCDDVLSANAEESSAESRSDYFARKEAFLTAARYEIASLETEALRGGGKTAGL